MLNFKSVTILKEFCHISSITETIPAFAGSLEEFTAKLDEIGELASEQEKKSTGATLDKSASRVKLSNAMLEISSALQVLGAIDGNEELLENSKYTKSDLRNARDTALVDIAKSLEELVIKHPRRKQRGI